MADRRRHRFQLRVQRQQRLDLGVRARPHLVRAQEQRTLAPLLDGAGQLLQHRRFPCHRPRAMPPVYCVLEHMFDNLQSRCGCDTRRIVFFYKGSDASSGFRCHGVGRTGRGAASRRQEGGDSRTVTTAQESPRARAGPANRGNPPRRPGRDRNRAREHQEMPAVPGRSRVVPVGPDQRADTPAAPSASHPTSARRLIGGTPATGVAARQRGRRNAATISRPTALLPPPRARRQAASPCGAAPRPGGERRRRG